MEGGSAYSFSLCLPLLCLHFCAAPGSPRVPGTGLNIVCMAGTDLRSYFLHIRHRICFFLTQPHLFLLVEIRSSFPLTQEDTTGTQCCLYTWAPDEMAGQDLHPKKASVQATFVSMAGGFSALSPLHLKAQEPFCCAGAQAFLPRMPL